jgi:hypothetical protein
MTNAVDYAIKNPGTTVQIATALGLGVSKVRMELIAAFKEGRIGRITTNGNKHQYGPVITAKPKAQATARPGTRTVEIPRRDLDRPVTTRIVALNGITLPAEPPTQRLEALLRVIDAEAAQRASVAESVGVYGYPTGVQA